MDDYMNKIIEAAKSPGISGVLGRKAEEFRGRTTFILGAGFSRDFNNEKVPLSNDFLMVAERAGILDKNGRHKELINFVVKYFNDYRSVNIETLSTFLTTDLLPELEVPNEFRGKLYADLREVIVSTLEEVHQHPKNDETRQRYRRFVDFLVEIEANVITFNYDLILDQLLRESGAWSCRDGYAVPLGTYDSDDLIEAQTRRIGASKVKYFKLHGSLNWGKAQIADPYGRDMVYLSPTSVAHGANPLPILSVRRSTQKVVGSGSADFRMDPLIVPPILNKEILRKEPLLLNMWYLARDAVWKSRFIFIIGYSFPPTDFLFEFALRQAVSNPFRVFEYHDRDMRQINIIQPNESTAFQNRVMDIFKEGFFSNYFWTTERFLDTLHEVRKKL